MAAFRSCDVSYTADLIGILSLDVGIFVQYIKTECRCSKSNSECNLLHSCDVPGIVHILFIYVPLRFYTYIEY